MSATQSGDNQTPAEPVRLCAVGDLESGQAKRFDIGDDRIALVRVEDEWFAIGDECSHADYSLAEGEVDPEECTIECWKHGSLFSLKTGVPETLPATRPVPVYDLVIADGEVAVRLPSRGANDE